MTRDELLKNISENFQDLMTYLESLSEVDFITNTDAAGWTVKDHVIHLSLWETFLVELLNKRSPREAMGIDEATWEEGDFDAMNAVMQQNYRDMPLDAVFQRLRDVHQELVSQIEALTDDDLALAVSRYSSDFGSDVPVSSWVEGSSSKHYPEHRPWIEAIVAG